MGGLYARQREQLDGALHLTVTCRPSTTWRPPSRRLGVLGHVIRAVGVPILLAISPRTLLKVASSKPASNPPSRCLGVLGHVIVAEDVPILLPSVCIPSGRRQSSSQHAPPHSRHPPRVGSPCDGPIA